MNKVWPWIFGIAFALFIIALLLYGRAERQAYWVARGTVPRPVVVAQVEDLTMIRFPCRVREGTIETAKACGFYVWKK